MKIQKEECSNGWESVFNRKWLGTETGCYKYHLLSLSENEVITIEENNKRNARKPKDREEVCWPVWSEEAID